MSLQTDHSKIKHDINSALSSVMGAVELINDEWEENPELVEKILPLTKEKLMELHEKLALYYRSK